VSFLSDYGVGDEFVGVVKGVIADIAPHVAVLDLTHEIPAFDVRAGSLALARSITYVPEGVAGCCRWPSLSPEVPTKPSS